MNNLVKLATALLVTVVLNSTQLLSTGIYSIPSEVLPLVYKNVDLKGLFDMRTVNLGSIGGEKGRAPGEDSVAKFLNNPNGYGPYLLAGTFMQRIKTQFQSSTLEGANGYFIWFSDQVSHGDRTIQKEWLNDDVKSTDALMGRFDIIYDILVATEAERAEMVMNHVDGLKLFDEVSKARERGKIQDFYSWVLKMFPLESFPSLKIKEPTPYLGGSRKSWIDTTSLNLGIHPHDLKTTNYRLRYLSPVVGQMKELVYLYVGYQELTFLPNSIRKLTKLKNLDLAENKIQVLPDLSKNSQISFISIVGNKISSIPEYIIDFPDLMYFYINGNPLDSASVDMLKNLEDRKFKLYYDSTPQEGRLIKDE